MGIDPHKQTHTAVAVSAATGEQLGVLTVPATPAGFVALDRWAASLPVARYALEDCRHVSGRLERFLLAAGRVVLRVPPRSMAGQRRVGRVRGKSDSIDALAVARAALREPHLAAARRDPAAEEIDLLLSHHDDLVAERTRMQNRLRWHLHDLGLGHDLPAGVLDRACWLDRVDRQLEAVDGLRAELARELVATIRTVTVRVRSLERELDHRTAQEAPNTRAICGCGALNAAKFIAETGDVSGYGGDAAFALTAGVAPLDCSSGRQQRHRLNRSGNRQLNLALHRVAIYQGQHYPPAIAYLRRRQQEGKTRREALRCLKRYLARNLWHALRADAALRSPTPNSTALSTPCLT